eukprot:Pgem_evm1s4257
MSVVTCPTPPVHFGGDVKQEQQQQQQQQQQKDSNSFSRRSIKIKRKLSQKDQFKFLNMYTEITKAMGEKLPLQIQSVKLNRLGTQKEKCFCASGESIFQWLFEFLKETYPKKCSPETAINLCNLLMQKGQLRPITIRKLSPSELEIASFGGKKSTYTFIDSKTEHYEFYGNMTEYLETREDINLQDLISKKGSIRSRGSMRRLSSGEQIEPNRPRSNSFSPSRRGSSCSIQSTESGGDVEDHNNNGGGRTRTNSLHLPFGKMKSSSSKLSLRSSIGSMKDLSPNHSLMSSASSCAFTFSVVDDDDVKEVQESKESMVRILTPTKGMMKVNVEMPTEKALKTVIVMPALTIEKIIASATKAYVSEEFPLEKFHFYEGEKEEKKERDMSCECYLDAQYTGDTSYFVIKFE